MYEIVKFIFDELRADPDLTSLMGGEVRLYHNQAQPDSLPPYLVQEMDHRTEAPWGIEQGTVTLHIWTSGPDALLMYTIRDHIVRILERLSYRSAPGVSSIRFRKFGEFQVPEQGQRNSAPNTLERIHHRVLRFHVRWVADKDIQAVYDRVTES